MELTLGQKIRKIREIRGYTQAYVAKKIGVSQEQYSYLENKQKNIEINLLNLITKVLDISIVEIHNFKFDKIVEIINGDNLNERQKDEKEIYENFIKYLEAENDFLRNIILAILKSQVD